MVADVLPLFGIWAIIITLKHCQFTDPPPPLRRVDGGNGKGLHLPICPHRPPRTNISALEIENEQVGS
ncbi:hypothetical protein VTO42DRAFT_1524 [Malbranchea cinnamomea]